MGKVNKIINGGAHYYRFFLWADRKKRLEAVGYMVNFASRNNKQNRNDYERT